MERLISQARKGDPDAFTALMESQMQNMYKAARSVLCNDEDIADAISDTILVCWEKFSQLKEDRYFRTWMTRILLNKCTDILRKRKQWSGWTRFRRHRMWTLGLKTVSGKRH